MTPSDTEMLGLHLISRLWTESLCKYLLSDSSSNTYCPTQSGPGLSLEMRSYKRLLLPSRAVESSWGYILMQIARPCLSSCAPRWYPQTWGLSQGYKCSRGLLTLPFSSSYVGLVLSFSVSLFLWASLPLCRERTLKKYLYPGCFASISHSLIHSSVHSININWIPSGHHPSDLEILRVNKTGKNSFSPGTYHGTGTCIYLSGIPFLPLKVFSHWWF